MRIPRDSSIETGKYRMGRYPQRWISTKLGLQKRLEYFRRVGAIDYLGSIYHPESISQVWAIVFGTGDRLLAENAPHLRRKCSPIRELKLLVLNVITPTEAKMQGKPFLPIITRRCDSTARVVGLTHPETVMENIEDYMLNVILREEEAANYSKRVYERVKLIKLCLDGKERCLWDVEQQTMVKQDK